MFVQIMIYFLLAVEVLVAFLLVTVILMQRSKGQGAGLAFGGAVGESVFGGQMGNVLTRTTVVLCSIFLINTTVLAVLYSKKGNDPVGVTLPPVSSVLPAAASQVPSGGLMPAAPLEMPAADAAASGAGGMMNMGETVVPVEIPAMLPEGQAVEIPAMVPPVAEATPDVAPAPAPAPEPVVVPVAVPAETPAAPAAQP